MNTTENNKLIAEFMGFSLAEEIAPKLYINSKEKKQMYLSQMAYHSSWDWLMPVIYRITRLGISWSDEGTRLFLKIGDCLCLINLEATYNAVVDVIKWYNEQK